MRNTWNDHLAALWAGLRSAGSWAFGALSILHQWISYEKSLQIALIDSQQNTMDDDDDDDDDL